MKNHHVAVALVGIGIGAGACAGQPAAQNAAPSEDASAHVAREVKHLNDLGFVAVQGAVSSDAEASSRLEALVKIADEVAREDIGEAPGCTQLDRAAIKADLDALNALRVIEVSALVTSQ